MPKPLRDQIASLSNHDCGMRWDAMGEIGQVRFQTTRQGKSRWFVDLRPYAKIYSVPGFGPLETRQDAERVLSHIQGELARGEPIEAVLAQYVPKKAKPNLIEEKLRRWLQVKHAEMEAGDRSPTYLRELERWARSGGHFSWWYAKSVYDVSYGALEDWSLWLAKRGIGAKTRHNVVGGFHSFLGWLKRRGELRQIPEMPKIRVDEHTPTIIDSKTQHLILQAIPRPRRGAFLAMAHLGLRPGEARAMNAEDYRDGWLTVNAAMKGCGAAAPRRGTKTRKGRRIPVTEELREWIENHLTPRQRLQGGTPLFPNLTARNLEGRWSYYALRDEWLRACTSTGIRVTLYEGTKHAMATDALRRGVQERHIQAFLGHADIRSTRRYAQPADEGLIVVLPTRARTDTS